MMRTQTEAKRFFVEKVIAQARLEGVSLSDAEREMLLWSESDPDITIDPALPGRLEAEISDDDYEGKVTGLITRSFDREIHVNSAAETEWKEAFALLRQGDHYIQLMLDEAVGHRWKNWWQKLLGT